MKSLFVYILKQEIVVAQFEIKAAQREANTVNVLPEISTSIVGYPDRFRIAIVEAESPGIAMTNLRARLVVDTAIERGDSRVN